MRTIVKGTQCSNWTGAPDGVRCQEEAIGFFTDWENLPLCQSCMDAIREEIPRIGISLGDARMYEWQTDSETGNTYAIMGSLDA